MSFGSFENSDSSPISEINVTPFVDIMLVLLIVFMITMPVISHTIPLQLPTNKENTDTNNNEPIRLSINIDGEYYLNESLLSISELEEKLRDIRGQNSDAVLAIAADKSVSYEKVVDALSTAQIIGISKIGFVIETEPK